MSGAEESSCIVLMHGLPDICQDIKPVALEAFFCYMQTRSLDNTSCSKATSSDNGIESECALTRSDVSEVGDGGLCGSG